MTAEAPLIELRGEIGAGATGRVWRGVLLANFGEWPAGAEVAIKRLHRELEGDARARASFQTEGEAGASARHPGLARLIHAGADDAGSYLAFEYVPGDTLRAVLARNGRLPEPLLRSVAAQVAGGLAALHAAGWVHGDVKPENMRLDAGGRAVLLDLGFARRLRRRSEASRAPETSAEDSPAIAVEPAVLAASEGVNPGSLAYLAPERARGEAGDEKSDVFSLGVALHELATGLHPFADTLERARQHSETGFSSGSLLSRSIDAPGADRLLAAIATARVLPASRLVPQLSPFLDHLLLEVLRRDASSRPSARELARRLTEQESGPWWRAQIDFESGTARASPSELESAHLTPLVGRDGELAELLTVYRDVVRPRQEETAPTLEAGAVNASESAIFRTKTPGFHGCAVWLSGPVGSGKSRLMSDFAARARASDDPPVYLYGRCSATDEERPCAPILRLFLRWLQLPAQARSLGARERAELARIAPPREAATLEQALDAHFSGATETSVVAALARWLVLLSRRKPLVVFLDDVNFADEGTLTVLALCAEELARSRLLLVLGHREHDELATSEQLANLRRRLEARGLLRELRLEPLSEQAVLDLVTRLFHHSAPRLRIAQVLFARSRGNPGLLAEILRGLIERGEAHTHHEAAGSGSRELVLTMPPERLPLPESLSNLIQERYQKLPTDDRRWLQRLAVVGGRISPGFVVRAFEPATALEVDGVLARLVQTGWLVPAGDRYRFARPALREALYRALAPESRMRLHAQAAHALEPRGGRRLSLDDAFQRAFHLRAAGEHGALLRVLRPLLGALIRRGQTQRVHALARWGLEALDALPRTKSRDRARIEFLEAAADASDRLGNRAEQRRWLDHLSELPLSPERDAEPLARVYLLHGRYAVSTGQYGLARGFLRNAVELVQHLEGAEEVASEALRRLSAVQAHVGELKEARELAVRSLELAGHDPQRAVALIQLALIDLLEDELESALSNVDRALRLLRAASDWTLPGVFAAAHMLRGRIYRLAGRPERALGAMQHAVRLARQAGERRLEMEATARLGGLMLDISRPEEAEARLRDALLIANEIEDRRGQTLAGLWLAILLWEQGDAEAGPLLGRVGRMAREMGLGRAEALCLAIQARVARAADRIDEALAASERAIELVERHGAELADRIVISGTRALVLHSAGRAPEAAALVKGLRQRLRSESRRFENPDFGRRHREATTRLLEAVLSPVGVIYPRVAPRGPADAAV